MNKSHKRFFWIVMLSFGETLLPILALNLILANNSLNGRRDTLLASQRQQSGTVLSTRPGCQRQDRQLAGYLPNSLRAWLLPICRLYNHGLLFTGAQAGGWANVKGINQ